MLNIEGPDPAPSTRRRAPRCRCWPATWRWPSRTRTLYRETRWYAGLLATLYEIGKETASILDLDQLLHRVAEVVKRVIDYEMFGILLLDEAPRRAGAAQVGLATAPSEEKTRIKLGEGLCGAAALTKQPILVGDVRKDPRYLTLIPETRSELVVPLVHKDRVVGVFDLESPALDRFTEEHVKVLTPLASQVAVAIENARLYDELRAPGRAAAARSWTIAQRRPARPVPRGVPDRARAGRPPRTSCPPASWAATSTTSTRSADGLLGLAVGDVAGKGVPAALYGAFASGTVRARAFERRAPADLLTRVNRTLRRRGVEGLFCTLAFALFDFAAADACAWPTPACPIRCTTARPAPLLRADRGGGPAPRRLRRRHLRGAHASSWSRATSSCSTPTASPRPSRRQEEYGIARLRHRWRSTRARRRRGLGERILADVDRFMDGRPPRRRRDPGRGEGPVSYAGAAQEPAYEADVPTPASRRLGRCVSVACCTTSAGTPRWSRRPQTWPLGTQVAVILGLPDGQTAVEVHGTVIRAGPGQRGRGPRHRGPVHRADAPAGNPDRLLHRDARARHFSGARSADAVNSLYLGP